MMYVYIPSIFQLWADFDFASIQDGINCPRGLHAPMSCCFNA